MKLFFLLLSITLGTHVLAQTQRTFNALIPETLADPSVSKFGDTYYMYGTTDIDKGLHEMGKPVVWKSKDFVNWSFEGTILSQIDWSKPYSYKDKDGKNAEGFFRYWAPGKAVEKNGKYYLFPTIVYPDWSSTGTYVVVSDHPEGPFEFTNGSGIHFPRAADETQYLLEDIDGEPFIDDNGEAYIYWRKRKAIKLNDDLLSTQGETVQMTTSFSGYSEGPVMFKRNDTYYYVYTLSGHANYCNGYMMSTQSPLSGFTAPEGKDIFIYSDLENGVWGPGHGNVFQEPDKDEYYFLYLEYGEGSTTRQVFANKMEFNDDGTIVPVVVDYKGVGHLSAPTKGENLAAGAKVLASSYRKDKETVTKLHDDPNTLNVNHVPDGGKELKRTFSYIPQNANDQSNSTRWWASEEDETPWLMLDLGQKKKVSSVEMAFIFPTYGHSWKLEKSMDGKKWITVKKDMEKVKRSPHVAGAIGKCQYLKLSILDGPAGLWEIKVY